MPARNVQRTNSPCGVMNNIAKLLTNAEIVLKYESAAQLVPILRPLIAPNNIVVAYPSNNTLAITNYASNLKRI